MTLSSFSDPCLQSILKRIAQEEGFLQLRFSISSASNPGENYCGRMFRTVISEVDETKKNERSLSLIFKVSPVSKSKQRQARVNALFHTETDAYQTVLPALNNILKKYGITKSDIFPGTVRCLASHLDDSCQVLVLEDKCAEGYHMIGDKVPLDVDHCRLILKKLALWHASSIALIHYEPETTERLKKLITKQLVFSDINSTLLDEFKHNAQEGLKLLPQSFKNENVAFTRMEEIVENFHEQMVRANELPSDLFCIIHGDCWFNNILFKYNKDDVLEDICTVDLQLTRFASPVVELSYMFYTCTSKETRDASQDELLRFYHSEVSTLLRMMHCDPEKIIPWELLQEHFRKYGKAGPMVVLPGLCAKLVPIDVSERKNDGFTFAGRQKVTDPKQREELLKKLAELIDHTYRCGYI